MESFAVITKEDITTRREGNALFASKSNYTIHRFEFSTRITKIIDYQPLKGDLVDLDSWKPRKFIAKSFDFKPFLITCSSYRNQLHLNYWNKPKETLSISTSEKIKKILITRCGNYLVAGTFKGSIFIWHLSSSTLLKTVKCHVNEITDLKELYDGFIVSSGYDGKVIVWFLSNLADISSGSKPMPFHEFKNFHPLPVLSILPLRHKILTSCQDKVLRLFHIPSKSLLLKILLPNIAKKVVVDSLERSLFYFTFKSKLIKFKNISARQVVVEVGKDTFGSCSEALGDILINQKEDLLVSATALSGKISVWSIASREIIKTVTLNKPVSRLFACFNRSEPLNTKEKRVLVEASENFRKLAKVQSDIKSIRSVVEYNDDAEAIRKALEPEETKNVLTLSSELPSSNLSSNTEAVAQTIIENKNGKRSYDELEKENKELRKICDELFNKAVDNF